MSWFELFIVFFLSTLLVYFILLQKVQKNAVIKEKKVLFVTSHPDDECMFFSPAITNIIKFGEVNNNEIFLACLSKGNYEGLGIIRENELLKSCLTLGIKSENLFVFDHPYLILFSYF